MAIAALSAYNSFELTKLPPDGGGRDQQTVEWNMHMDACFDAKSRADEDREMERIIKDAEGADGDGPTPYDADEIPT